jgi:glycine betaine/proline transport system permease protein
VRSLNQVNIPLGVESGLAIVILAIILDRMLRQRQRRATSGKSNKT